MIPNLVFDLDRACGRDGKHRTFSRLLVARPLHPARVAKNDLVFVDRRHEYRAQQAVGFGGLHV
jgi:hypothetical protein